MIRKPTLSELALWAALPMAHTSNIEGRVTMILDQTCFPPRADAARSDNRARRSAHDGAAADQISGCCF